MDDLAYDSVIPTLFREVPEAKEAYAASETPGDPLPYIVFGLLDESFFTPTVKRETDAELLARIFQFFELMATSSSAEVANLLYVGLFEGWVGDAALLKKAFRHMKPATKALAREAAHSLQCGHNLPPA